MKKHTHKIFLQLALIASLGLLLTWPVAAQTFTNLHNFSVQSPTNSAFPAGTLVFSGNALYGVAQAGGSANNGAVFRVNTDGTGYTNLHDFTALHTTIALAQTNEDGAVPYGGLILSGNTLYGTATAGGTSGSGTVFRVNTNGSSFTNLHNFTATSGSPFYTNSDGYNPGGDLILSGNTLYGVAQGGGNAGSGTIFKINTDGTAFTNLYSFSVTMGTPATNSDGRLPAAGLILSGNTLYGVTAQGGSAGNGTVFAINANGTAFTKLHNFSALSTNASGYFTNSDGVNPGGYLALAGDSLYGVAQYGGGLANGTVFKLNTNGTGFGVLHSFSPLSINFGGRLTNNDGAIPTTGLLILGNTIYGSSINGGNGGNGTLFALNTDGSAFTLLHSFTAGDTNSDGAEPNNGLALAGNTLYGVAYVGGSAGGGTLFSITLPQPQLTIVRAGTNVILTWPTNLTAFTLQATTNLASTAVWSNVSPASVVVNGQNTVTNLISSARKFYRLSQ